METITGTIAFNGDNLVFEIEPGIQLPISTTSMGNKYYKTGEQVNGVIIDGKLYLCKSYAVINEVDEYTGGDTVYGYISRDKFNESFIHIHDVNQNREIALRRENVLNY